MQLKLQFSIAATLIRNNSYQENPRHNKFAEIMFVFVLAAMLFSTSLALNINSICIFLFIFICFLRLKSFKFCCSKSLVVPIALYSVMCMSVIWTTNFSDSIKGLQKEFVFLILPLTFMFLPKFSQDTVYKIIRIYSFGMVGFAIFCLIRAGMNYDKLQTNAVFLFQNLVSVELNAIYIAAFSSLCLFYFIILKNKKPIDFFGLYIIAIFVVLLNSKTIFFIDIILFICHYLFFSKTKLGVKSVTIVFIVTFFLLSVFFIKQVQDRIIEEYQTSFVDNTIYKNSDPNQKTYNVSLDQALTNKKFETNSFFPGTAYRVFQARICKEIIQEKNYLWLTGLGFNASDQAIKEKHHKYGLFKTLNYHNFHNQYLQFFAEIGVFGFLLLIAMVLLNLKTAIQNKDFLHIVFAVTMIILFLTESLLCRQRGIVFFIVLYCLFNSIHHDSKLKQKL